MTQVKLPELPPPDLEFAPAGPLFGSEKVRAYALKAVEAERERCAKLCDALGARYSTGGDGALLCADAIRSPVGGK